uniref:F-box domain-containing protein n=2 Tax=Aegilops tauschii subsp. strangulata TaxID=200361 RepID=A0A453FYM3_AEGTS
MKTSAPMVCGQRPRIDRRSVKPLKTTRSKDLQLHHLPTDVLRVILSRLTMKEAVRMSILSRKWSRLWKCYPKLVFTRATMRRSNATTGPAKPLRTRFIRGINSIQRQLKSSNLNKFVVKFALRKRHTPHIDRCINFCASSMAKHVVLDLCPGPKGSTDTDDKYSFPLHLLGASGGSCVKSLSLGFVNLTLPPDHRGFANLKKLSRNSSRHRGSRVPAPKMRCS